MSEIAYQRIQYPDAAENLNSYENYKVFLEHWDTLSNVLRSNFEIVKTRRETRAISLFGTQGVGKTMFANRLAQDLDGTLSASARGAIAPDRNNLWHRITGGAGLDANLITSATRASVIHKVENSVKWTSTVADFVSAQTNRVAIVIADNAERSYFCQGLLEITLAEYLDLKERPGFMNIVAQKLVEACRERIRNSLILILANDEMFLNSLQTAIDQQHHGMMSLHAFPEPSPRDRETIVRVNTNRLNPFSYWFCIDRAGPQEKLAVYTALDSASSFRQAFRATDNALNTTTRAGRPANRNLISLIVMHPGHSAPEWLAAYAGLDRVEFENSWVKSVIFRSRWAERSLADERECGLIESEWQLRIITLGEPFVKALLAGTDSCRILCRDLINKLRTVHGPATTATTRRQHETGVQNNISRWPDLSAINTDDFWAQGQSRSGVYEASLKKIFSTYDRVVPGFLECRPDLVIERYRPCKVLSAGEADAGKITQAIKRDAHVLEFTASQNPTADAIANYLRTKLPNYVRTTQEQ